MDPEKVLVVGVIVHEVYNQNLVGARDLVHRASVRPMEGAREQDRMVSWDDILAALSGAIGACQALCDSDSQPVGRDGDSPRS